MIRATRQSADRQEAKWDKNQNVRTGLKEIGRGKGEVAKRNPSNAVPMGTPDKPADWVGQNEDDECQPGHPQRGPHEGKQAHESILQGGGTPVSRGLEWGGV